MALSDTTRNNFFSTLQTLAQAFLLTVAEDFIDKVRTKCKHFSILYTSSSNDEAALGSEHIHMSKISHFAAGLENLAHWLLSHSICVLSIPWLSGYANSLFSVDRSFWHLNKLVLWYDSTWYVLSAPTKHPLPFMMKRWRVLFEFSMQTLFFLYHSCFTWQIPSTTHSWNISLSGALLTKNQIFQYPFQRVSAAHASCPARFCVMNKNENDKHMSELTLRRQTHSTSDYRRHLPFVTICWRSSKLTCLSMTVIFAN